MNKTTSPLITLGLIFVMALSHPATTKAEQNPLQKRWKIISVGEHQGNHLGFITFTDSMVKGQSTCNLYEAVYTLKPNQELSIHRINTTELICKLGNRMPIEKQYVEGLEQVKNYTLKDGVLTLFKADKTEIARFQ